MISAPGWGLALTLGALPGLPTTPGATDWPMFQKDPAHTGAQIEPSWPGYLKRCLTVDLPGTTQAHPILVGDYVFLFVQMTGIGLSGNALGWVTPTVQCRNRFTGSLVWSTSLGSMTVVGGSLTYADRRIFLQDVSNQVFCLNADSGALLWNRTVDSWTGYAQAWWALSASPVVLSGTVYVATSAGTLAALDESSGATLWTLPVPSAASAGLNPMFSSPAYDNGILYLGGDMGYVYGVNLSTKQVVFSANLGSPVEASPSILNGKLYVGTKAGRYYCLSLSTGAVLWSYLTSGWMAAGSTFWGQDVCFVGDDRKIYIADKDSGVLLCPPSGTADNYAHMNPIFIEGDILVAGCTGGLHLQRPGVCARIYNDEFGVFCGYFSSLVSKEGMVYGINSCSKLVIWCPTVYSSPSPSPSLTITLTPSPTRTPCPACSPTFTATRSVSRTSTPWPTKTGTQTRTPTRSATISATSTRTRTATASASATGTFSFSPSPTRTAILTQTPSPSPTQSFTRSWTHTLSPSLSPSPTLTPTGTPTFTYTWSRSMTFSLTPSPTATPSRTHTMMPSKTGTRTVTPTRTLTPQGGVEPHAWLTHNQIHPGEGKDCVTVHYLIPDYGKVKVTVYSLLGELVKTLVDLPESRGEHETQWCGENWQGRPVASGIYLIVVETPWFTFKDKAVVIK